MQQPTSSLMLYLQLSAHEKKNVQFLGGFQNKSGEVIIMLFFSPHGKELVFHLLTAKIIKLFSLLGL